MRFLLSALTHGVQSGGASAMPQASIPRKATRAPSSSSSLPQPPPVWGLGIDPIGLFHGRSSASLCLCSSGRGQSSGARSHCAHGVVCWLMLHHGSGVVVGAALIVAQIRQVSGLYFSTSPPNLVTSSSCSSDSSPPSPPSDSSLASASSPTASTSMVLPANFDAQRRAVKKEALSVRPSKRNCYLSDAKTPCRWTQRAG